MAQAKPDTPEEAETMTGMAWAAPDTPEEVETMPDEPEHTGLLEIEGLSVDYGSERVLSDASLSLREGEVLGVVGESGAGKSTLLRAIARLLPPHANASGRISFLDRELLTLPLAEMRRMRGAELAYLFQNAQLSLDPVASVRSQFDEVLKAHGRTAAPGFKEELLARMGIADAQRVLGSIPSELSGGLCQRVALAFSLAGRPKLLLADEPTSGLDAASQQKVAELLSKVVSEEGMAMILVGHDIDFVSSMAGRLAVMRRGCIVEQGPADEIMRRPQNPYTQELIRSVPHSSRVFVPVQPRLARQDARQAVALEESAPVESTADESAPVESPVKGPAAAGPSAGKAGR